MKFNDRSIKALKPGSKRKIYWESCSHGIGNLGIRVSPVGRKAWIFMYRFDNRARMLTLGVYPKMSVAQAHAACGAAINKRLHGEDPACISVEQNQKARAALTLTDLTNEYIEKWAKVRKKSWRADLRTFNFDVIPKWGRRKANTITRRDVIALLDGIVARGSPIQANRTLAIVRKMFNFAVSRDLLPASPCAAIMKPSPEKTRDRVLTPVEFEEFFLKLPKARMGCLVTLALHLQIFTAQRCGEVVSAEWSEFDLDARWWTIPSSKAKNKLSHRVPLSSQAIELIKQICEISGSSDWLFPSPKGDTCMTVRAVARAIRRNEAHFAIPHFTPHDLRRTAASHMTSMGISRLVVSKILNHAESGVTAVYDRHSYDREKKEALDLWGQRVEQITKGIDNVVPFPQLQTRTFRLTN